MKKSKLLKITSIIMAFSLVFSTIPVSATSTAPETLTIEKKSDGSFQLASRRLFSFSDSLDIYVDDEFESVYTTKDARHFQETQEGVYIEVEPISGSLTDYSTYQTMKNLNLPEEVLNDIAAMAANAEANELEGAGVTVFVPVQDSAMSARSGINEVTHSSTEYAGETFTHYEVYFTGMNSGWHTVKEGSDSRAVWNGISAVFFTVLEEAGSSVVESIPVVGPYVSLFMSGLGCIDAWEEATADTAITVNTENFSDARFFYTLYQKYTYFYVDDLDIERIGCRTKKIIVTKMETSTFMFSDSGGETVEKTIYPYETVKTTSYDSPEETAILFINQAYSQTEDIRADVGGMTYLIDGADFTWPSHWPSNP